VDGLPYDANLYTNLVGAACFALDLPELLMYLPVGLSATTGLAARVARNADDATLAVLIDDAAAQRPMAIAVSLVRELMFVAKKTQRPDLEAKASEHATRLLREADWADQAIWVENRLQVRRLLGWTASISSTDHEIRERIAISLTGRPELLEPILLAISQQSEQRDRNDWSRLLGIDVHVEDLPAWFPRPSSLPKFGVNIPD
jgi:hypothetical protein